MISAMQPFSAMAAPTTADEYKAQVQRVAREFEAVLTATMVKEGLKGMTATGMDGEDEGSSTYMDMTCEQLACFIGRQGVLGIADQIANSLQDKGGDTAHESH